MGNSYEINQKRFMITTHMVILLIAGCYGHITNSLCCDNVHVKPFKALMTNRSQWDLNVSLLSTCSIVIIEEEANAKHAISLLHCENTTLDLVNTYMNTANSSRIIAESNGHHEKHSSDKPEKASYNAIHLSNVSIDRRNRNTLLNKYVKLIEINNETTEYLSWIKSNLTSDDIDHLIGINKQLFFNLTILQLEHNEINNIGRAVLSALPNLLSLNLSDNQIDNDLLDKNIFENSPKLTQIDLSRNKLKSILVQNNKRSNQSTIFTYTYSESNIFGSLAHLEYLDLSRNSITDLPRNAFEGLKELKCINLAYNRLIVTPFQAFRALINIEQMDLSHNRLLSVLDNYFVKNTKLQVLLLQHNTIEKLSQYSLFGLSQLQHLDVSYNQLITIDRNAFDSLVTLETLNLRGNSLTTIPTMLFAGLKQMQRLDLSENDFKTLPNGVFASQYKLNQLFIDNTTMERLGNLVSRQNGTVDKNVLVHLQHVSIMNNPRLTEIDSITFRSMPAVEHLKLSGNKITSLPTTIDELKNLISLDISKNDLTFIPKQLNELKYLKSLNLLGNNYACDCKMYWLTNWVDNLRNASDTDVDIEPLNQLNQLKCRHGYPGDMIKVLQHLQCTKPVLKHVSESRQHLLNNEAQLECLFGGNPAPDVIWITPTNQIIRHHADPDTKPVFVNNHSTLERRRDGSNPKDPHARGTIDYHKIQEHGTIFTFHENMMGFSLLENGTLRIRNVSRADSGLYTCYGYNMMGYSTADIR